LGNRGPIEEGQPQVGAKGGAFPPRGFSIGRISSQGGKSTGVFRGEVSAFVDSKRREDTTQCGEEHPAIYRWTHPSPLRNMSSAPRRASAEPHEAPTTETKEGDV